MATKGSTRKAGQFRGVAGQLKEAGKLGLGAMARPETECWIARTMLFAHMESMLASDLRELRDCCLPLYRNLYELGRRLWPDLRGGDFPAVEVRNVLPNKAKEQRALYVTTWSALSEAVVHFTEAKELAGAVSRWAQDRHMDTDWFLDGILVNLCGWRKDPEAEGSLLWSYPGMLGSSQNQRTGVDSRRLQGLGTLDRRATVPAIKPYNPSAQTRREHREALELELNGYYEQQENLFSRVGFKKVSPKRKRTENDPWLHFEWFIKFQMQGRKGSEIAGKHQLRAVGEDAVYRAVKELARILQVPLRPRG